MLACCIKRASYCQLDKLVSDDRCSTLYVLMLMISQRVSFLLQMLRFGTFGISSSTLNSRWNTINVTSIFIICWCLLEGRDNSPSLPNLLLAMFICKLVVPSDLFVSSHFDLHNFWKILKLRISSE